MYGGFVMSEIQKVEYDPEPIKYCSKCLSIKIEYEGIQDVDYCGDCGCMDIAESSLEEWEKKYEARYGHKLVEKRGDPKKHAIFQMPLSKLKSMIYNSPNWKEAIGCLYPCPQGYSKLDTILLVFDKLIKENRLDEFRIKLTKIKL